MLVHSDGLLVGKTCNRSLVGIHICVTLLVGINAVGRCVLYRHHLQRQMSVIATNVHWLRYSDFGRATPIVPKKPVSKSMTFP